MPEPIVNKVKKNYKDIADAIRDKKGTHNKMTAAEMPGEISSIQTGINPTGTLNVTANGTYDVKTKANVAVNVPNPSTGTLKITKNGSYDVTEKAGVNVDVAGLVPTGNKNITTTDQVDVTEFATAQVQEPNLVAANIKKDVSILGVVGTNEGYPEPTGKAPTITENGTNIDIKDYASVDVNVPQPSGKAPTITTNGTNIDIEAYSTVDVNVPNPSTGTLNITENGEYDVTEKAGVNVTVQQPSGKKPTAITENGTNIDVTWYETVDVNVPSSASGSTNITTNGTHDVAAYAEAVVAVPQPSGKKPTAITANGENIDVTWYETVDVAVPQPSGKAPTITENGTDIDISQYATVDVAVEGGGSDDPLKRIGIDELKSGTLFISNLDGYHNIINKNITNPKNDEKKLVSVCNSSSYTPRYRIVNIPYDNTFKVIGAESFDIKFNWRTSNLGFGWVISSGIDYIEPNALREAEGVFFFPKNKNHKENIKKYFDLNPNISDIYFTYTSNGAGIGTLRNDFALYNGFSRVQAINIFEEDGYDGIDIVTNSDGYRSYMIYAFNNTEMTAEIVSCKDYQILNTVNHNGNTYQITGWYKDGWIKGGNVFINTGTASSDVGTDPLPSWLAAAGVQKDLNPLRTAWSKKFRSTVFEDQNAHKKYLVDATSYKNSNNDDDDAFTIAAQKNWQSDWIYCYGPAFGDAGIKMATDAQGTGAVDLGYLQSSNPIYTYFKFTCDYKLTLTLKDDITDILPYAFARNWCVPENLTFTAGEDTVGGGTSSFYDRLRQYYFHNLGGICFTKLFENTSRILTVGSIASTSQVYQENSSTTHKIELVIPATSKLKHISKESFNMVSVSSSSDITKPQRASDDCYGLIDNPAAEAVFCHYYVNELAEMAKLEWHYLPRFKFYIDGVEQTKADLQAMSFDFNDFVETDTVSRSDIRKHGLPVRTLYGVSDGDLGELDSYRYNWDFYNQIYCDASVGLDELQWHNYLFNDCTTIALPGISLQEFIDEYKCWYNCPLSSGITLILSDTTITTGDTSIMPEYPEGGSSSSSSNNNGEYDY